MPAWYVHYRHQNIDIRSAFAVGRQLMAKGRWIYIPFRIEVSTARMLSQMLSETHVRRRCEQMALSAVSRAGTYCSKISFRTYWWISGRYAWIGFAGLLKMLNNKVAK